jgi:tetratricopeptide (TPR) repeat protein
MNAVGETEFDPRTREPVMVDALTIGTVLQNLEPVLLALAAKSPFARRKDVLSRSERRRPGPRPIRDFLLNQIALAALCLTLAVSQSTFARQPSADDRVGKAVLPKARQFTLKDVQKGTPVKAPAEIYQVARMSGASLLLSGTGISGWAAADQVVPLEQADDFFTKQIRANPADAFPHLMRAIVSMASKGDVDRALGDLTEAIRLTPGDADTYMIRAEAWRARGDLGKALADCEAVLRLSPKSVGALGTRAALWAESKEFDKAIADYSEVLRRDPQVVPAYYGRAVAEGEKGEIDRAIADLGTAIQLDPRHPDPYLMRAAAWKHKGDADKALADLNDAIRIEPRSAHAYHSRGKLWSEKKNYEKAIDDFSQAIRLEPENAVGYCDRGYAWKAAKQYDNAIADYSEAVRLDPRDSDAYCGRGWVWREKQEFARSLADFGQALRIDPRDACALDGRAWIFATSPNPTYRDGKKAVEVAIEACELTRWKEAYCLETLAAAYAESGDFASAVKWQIKAIELEADAKEKEDYRARLKLFQEKKPYREPKA